MRNCSERTILCWQFKLKRFVNWLSERGIDCMSDVTPELMGAYRRSLFHYRNPRTGQPLKFDTQASYLIPVRRWFDWMKVQTFIDSDPTTKVELPKSEERLPTSVLTSDEVESLLNAPDIKTKLGLRDRAIMETFYSSGIRCGELIALDVYDVNLEREILTIRQGKGNKDRVVPIGTRALTWIEKWLNDIRPAMVTNSSAESLFVSKNGRRLGPNYVSNVVKGYLNSIGITYRGSCHLLRHTAATLMRKFIARRIRRSRTQSQIAKLSESSRKQDSAAKAAGSRSFLFAESTTIIPSNLFLARVTKNLKSGHHPQNSECHEMDLVRHRFRSRISE